jgi:DeoR family glycerol-3-phosphate regulon repressor
MASKKIRRRDLIVQVVQERGGASVGSLAEMLGVSTQTIRRDLDILCDSRDLRRVHGRIELSPELLNTPFDQRADTNIAGKRSIADLVADLIPSGSTVFISIGSTPLEVAKSLIRRKELTVITNNLGAAMALSEELSNRIILPGGEMRLPDRDFIGEGTVDYFSRFRAEFAVFGVAGVAEDGGLLDFHPAEVRARQQMQQNAQISILVLDKSKFGRVAPALGGTLNEPDHVVVDCPPAAEFDHVLEALGDKLVFAEGAK